jgi:hypothetical protein
MDRQGTVGKELNPDPHISKLGPGMCIFEDLNPNTGSFMLGNGIYWHLDPGLGSFTSY